MGSNVVPELIAPDPRVRVSFVSAMEEFAAEGRGADGDDSVLARQMRQHGHLWPQPEGFREFTRILLADAKETTPRLEGWVPMTTLWWVEGDEFLGRIGIRHRLTSFLLAAGGHVGYDVRPSARRRGHATAMLRAALPVLRGMGIESALLTCEVTNVASRKVIEACGGVYEDERDGLLRFWVPT
jgi:predicted acetyltransferase